MKIREMIMLGSKQQHGQGQPKTENFGREGYILQRAQPGIEENRTKLPIDQHVAVVTVMAVIMKGR